MTGREGTTMVADAPSTAPPTVSPPPAATESRSPAPSADGRRPARTPGPGSGGAIPPGGGAGSGGRRPGAPSSAWWRAERLLRPALRAVACLPLAALVLILAALVWKA